MSFCHYGLVLKLDQPLQRPAGAFGLPQGTLLLTACIAVVGANSLALGPIAPSVAESFHAEVQAVLWATSAFGLGTSASALFLARYIDRLGRGGRCAWRWRCSPSRCLPRAPRRRFRF